jgi:hypothetical protein
MNIGACKDCRFYKAENDDAGFCRRYPPKLNAATNLYQFAVTSPGAWCGEFVRNLDHTVVQTRSY